MFNIICSCYQGVGKSTAARKYMGVIDLESSCFFINNVRDDNWYIPYCNIAIDLSRQRNLVFVSSHQCVRDYLIEHCDPGEFCTVTPSHKLREAWIEKLWSRYETTGLYKDMKAWANAKERYDANIDEINSTVGIKHYVIDSIQYNLMEILYGKVNNGR